MKAILIWCDKEPTTINIRQADDHIKAYDWPEPPKITPESAALPVNHTINVVVFKLGHFSSIRQAYIYTQVKD